MATNAMRRGSLTVLAGSALGFGITLLLTPVISRLYDPSTFGAFSTVVAVGSALVGVSTFRLEVRAQGEPDDGRARSLFGLSAVSVLGWSVVGTMAGGVAVMLGALTAWWFLGLVILAGSAQLVGTAVLVRSRRYRLLGASNLVQGGGTGTLQVALGAAGPWVASLMAGFILPRAVWLAAARHQPAGNGPSFRETWRGNRNYAALAGSSALVNSSAGQGLVILAALAYGGSGAGILAMAIRVLISPLTIIGQAAAAAGIGECGKLLRAGQRADTLLHRGVRDLLVVGALPCAVAVFFAPVLVPRVLGEDWAAAGPVMAWLAVGGLLQFAVAPYSQLLNMTHRSRLMLRWDVARLAVVVASMLVPGLLDAPLWSAAAAFSLSQLVLYAWLFRLVHAAAADPPKEDAPSD